MAKVRRRIRMERLSSGDTDEKPKVSNRQVTFSKTRFCRCNEDDLQKKICWDFVGHKMSNYSGWKI